MWSAILVWRIEFEDAALKELAKLDKPVARRILAFLRERVADLEDPRSVGEALKGSRLGDLWKYRVGDYRILASIRLLAAAGKLHEVRLLLLPGVNDADDLLRETGRWLAAIDPRMRVKVIGFRPHGVRPSPLALREPSAEQRAHYAETLRATGAFDLTVV